MPNHILHPTGGGLRTAISGSAVTGMNWAEVGRRGSHSCHRHRRRSLDRRTTRAKRKGCHGRQRRRDGVLSHDEIGGGCHVVQIGMLERCISGVGREKIQEHDLEVDLWVREETSYVRQDLRGSVIPQRAEFPELPGEIPGSLGEVFEEGGLGGRVRLSLIHI